MISTLSPIRGKALRVSTRSSIPPLSSCTLTAPSGLTLVMVPVIFDSAARVFVRAVAKQSFPICCVPSANGSAGGGFVHLTWTGVKVWNMEGGRPRIGPTALRSTPIAPCKVTRASTKRSAS